SINIIEDEEITESFSDDENSEKIERLSEDFKTLRRELLERNIEDCDILSQIANEQCKISENVLSLKNIVTIQQKTEQENNQTVVWSIENLSGRLNEDIRKIVRVEVDNSRDSIIAG